MTDWEWWAGHPDEDSYDIAQADTRDAVIAAAMRELRPASTEGGRGSPSAGRKREGEGDTPRIEA